MRLVFAGTPEAAIPSLEALLEHPSHEVVAVVTRPDAPSGRGRHLHPSPVAARAAEAGVEVLKPARVREPEFLDRLRSLAPDCCPVVAYGALLPQVALDIPPHGWINLHFSVLPAWRGAAPVQHAIRAGDDITGATTFRIVKELDAGPVFGVLTSAIGPTDTSGDLLPRLAISGARLLIDTLDGIEAGTLSPHEQPADGLSYASKVSVEDCEIHWSLPAHVIDRLIRSAMPAPGAWTTFRGERLKVEPLASTIQAVSVRPTDGSGDSVPETVQPGEIRATKKQVFVGTSTVPVELGTVQPKGKKPMRAADWARGIRLAEGERFE